MVPFNRCSFRKPHWMVREADRKECPECMEPTAASCTYTTAQQRVHIRRLKTAFGCRCKCTGSPACGSCYLAAIVWSVVGNERFGRRQLFEFLPIQLGKQHRSGSAGPGRL